MKIEFKQAADDLVSFYVFNGWLTPEKKTFRLQKRVFWGILALSPVLLILVNNEPEQISYLGVLVAGLILFTVGFMLAGKVKQQMINTAYSSFTQIKSFGKARYSKDQVNMG